MKKYKIFFLHGWLFDSRIWFGFNKTISEKYESILIDLPGYGGNKNKTLSPINYCKEVFENLSSPTIIIGWSFGGLLALLGLSENYKNIEKIILINSHPYLISNDQLRNTISSKSINNLKDNLILNREEAIKKFFFECVKSSSKEVSDYRLLIKKFKLSSIPNNDILINGLNNISNIDLFNDLMNSKKEILIIQGGKDKILGAASFTKLKENKHIKLCVLDDVPHIPFISFKKEIYNVIEKFI